MYLYNELMNPIAGPIANKIKQIKLPKIHMYIREAIDDYLY